MSSTDRRLELNTELRKLQEAYQAKAEELKALDAERKKGIQIERFKEYNYKIGLFHRLEKEEKIQELTDEDRVLGKIGQSTGLAYVDLNTQDGYCYLMLKQKEDYARMNTLVNRMYAVKQLDDKSSKESNEKHIKVILGEETYD